MTRRVSILGASGSLGRQACRLLARQAEPCEVVALTGHMNLKELIYQALVLRPRVVATPDSSSAATLREGLANEGIEILCGPGAVEEAASRRADLCIAAIVGMASLRPTTAALQNVGTLALASKECLVVAGRLFLEMARASGCKVLPLDSEHHAIGQLLSAHGRDGLRRIVLTASGGPFLRHNNASMAQALAADAERHPRWKMGQRISIDSATMFNKARELIEAHHMFALPSQQIDVLVHPQSVVHGMVEYEKGQIYAHLAPTSMELVIADALGFEVGEASMLGIGDLANLEFELPDEDRFPALRIAREVLSADELAGCALNGALEVAVDAFIEGRIGFLAMADIVEESLGAPRETGAIRDIVQLDWADREARRVAEQIVALKEKGG